MYLRQSEMKRGEVSEEVCYHFEVFEDFMSFEKQEKSESVVNEKMITTPPVEESKYATHCDDKVRCVTEIIEGKKYRIKDDYISGHDFSIGEIVVAKEHSDDYGQAVCTNGVVDWYVNVLEVELVD